MVIWRVEKASEWYTWPHLSYELGTAKQVESLEKSILDLGRNSYESMQLNLKLAEDLVDWS